MNFPKPNNKPIRGTKKPFTITRVENNKKITQRKYIFKNVFTKNDHTPRSDIIVVGGSGRGGNNNFDIDSLLSDLYDSWLGLESDSSHFFGDSDSDSSHHVQ